MKPQASTALLAALAAVALLRAADADRTAARVGAGAGASATAARAAAASALGKAAARLSFSGRDEQATAANGSQALASGDLRPHDSHRHRQRHAGTKRKGLSADLAGPHGHLRTGAGGRAAQAAPSAASLTSEDDQGAAAAGLQRELAEVRQNRANVRELQQALAAQVALLRESTALQRVSTSAHGRVAAMKQVQKSEQLVKDTSAMLKESRAAASESARNVLSEVAEVRATLDLLSTEARAQLQAFASPHGDEDAAGESGVPNAEPALTAAASAAPPNQTADMDLDYDDAAEEEAEA